MISPGGRTKSMCQFCLVIPPEEARCSWLSTSAECWVSGHAQLASKFRSGHVTGGFQSAGSTIWTPFHPHQVAVLWGLGTCGWYLLVPSPRIYCGSLEWNDGMPVYTLDWWHGGGHPQVPPDTQPYYIPTWLPVIPHRLAYHWTDWGPTKSNVQLMSCWQKVYAKGVVIS